MAKYSLEIKKSAAKEIENLPKHELQIILRKIHSLTENPRPPGYEKLSGQDKYRIRCGDYRILYTIEDMVLIVCVVKVGHRQDVYRR